MAVIAGGLTTRQRIADVTTSGDKNNQDIVQRCLDDFDRHVRMR